MLIVETIGRIRREHFVKGKTIKEIVRDLGISRNTVRKALRSEETSFGYGRDTQPLPKLGPWSKKLDDLLETNAKKLARERLTLIRVFGTVQTRVTLSWSESISDTRFPLFFRNEYRHDFIPVGRGQSVQRCSQGPCNFIAVES